MDAKAITEKSKELGKAVASNASSEIIKNILNELKQGVKPTEEVLRSTRIGVAVNKLKGYKNRDVAALASEIVRKWRDEVEAKRSHSGTASPAPSQGTQPRQSSQVPTSQQAPPSQPATPKVPLDKRTSKTDEIKVNPTGNSARDRCATLLYDGLAFMSPDPAKTVLATASAIEGAIHTALGPAEKEPYKTKVRSLYQNLKNRANGWLRADLLAGRLSAERFVGMNHEELRSAERRAEDASLEKENMRLAQAPQEEKSVSTSLQCGKCKQKKVSYSQAQTRSADEPMTTFCECLNCGKRWKFS